MKLLEFARGSAFWTLDALKGGKVKAALTTLQNCEDGIWSENQIQEYQMEQIQRLLAHAKLTVPFYHNQSSIDLRDWPVVNKNVLRANGDAVLSNQYEKDSLIAMSTSGSTGTPFTCWQNVEKKKHVNAETLYYNGKAGFSIGRRIIYLRSVVAEVQKSGLQQFLQNIYLLDCNDLSDDGIKEKLKFIVNHSKGCGAMVMGYASTLTAFQQYFDRNGNKEVQDANVYGVVSGSEMLYDPTRIAIEKAFYCKCFSRYANEENGFLGQDDEMNNVFLVNRADYYVEILKMDCDIPAEEGEVGRIVVTDLYNFAMPMIRYDTGDVGAYVRTQLNGSERWAIGSFGGRKVDTIYDADNNLVSPHAITNMMWKYQMVKQFQFIQKDEGIYKLVINADRNNLNEEELLEDYSRILGAGAKVFVEYTECIPVLESGKRRYIVNEWK